MFRRATLLAALMMVLAVIPAVAQAQAPGPLPIPEPEVNTGLPGGLIQYSDIAAELNAIVRSSDRVKAKVLGQSAGGRDMYLVTVSDPGADHERTKQLRQLMLRDPARAQQMVEEFEDFRVPVFLNCSIHGNEYEGVDACIEIIRRLAFGNDAETLAILEDVILVVNVVQNPDGRVNNVRPNQNGFDVNRDYATNSQPESALVRDVLVAWNPMVFLDYHGYVNAMLIEPTTPPHNPNYEYDLYIRHALGQALAMEDGVVASYDMLRTDPDFAATYTEFIQGSLVADRVTIPFRDWEVGDWDDWPPIFAPMYAMYHGAYGSTLEAPLNPRFGSLEQRAARARVNKEAHIAAGWSTLMYVTENKQSMITDQLEVFRRGGNAIGPVPVEPGFVPGWGPEDQYPSDYPEAFIIPRGDSQKSELAAARMVNFLVDHGIDVGEARSSGTGFGSERYPAGSYVVSMKQPRRGLANTILETGYDISFKSPQMYDISGWSHGELWGATVVRVPKGTAVRGQTTRVREAVVAGSLPAGTNAGYSYSLDSQEAIEATNALLDAGVALQRGTGDTVIVPGAAKDQLGPLADQGIVFTALVSIPAGLETLEPVRVAAALGAEERFVVGSLGFDFDTVSTGALNGGTFDLNAYDVLLVSSSFNYNSLDTAARDALSAWLAAGGGVVTLGNTGATFNTAAGLLSYTSNRGPACATANGIVDVDNAPGSAVTGGFPADDTSFVFDPLYFTDLGAEVAADQRYTTGDVLLSGHWLGDFEDWEGDTTPGGPRCGGSSRVGSAQTDAAGHAAVVSGTDETGARVVSFGTNLLFRDHPKKLYQQFAQALYWVSAD